MTSCFVRTKLYCQGRWRQLRCSRCFASSSARLWLCSCGTTWNSCDIHAHIGFACGHERNTRPRLGVRSGRVIRMLSNKIPPPTPDLKRKPPNSISEQPTKRSRIAGVSQASSSQQPPVSATKCLTPDFRQAGISSHVASGFGSRTAKHPSPLSRGGAKAKARARHDDLAALAAVQRLREAKDNPL